MILNTRDGSRLNLINYDSKSNIYISDIFSRSLFAKHLIADEYHEQKSAGYTRLKSVCVQSRAACFWINLDFYNCFNGSCSSHDSEERILDN